MITCTDDILHASKDEIIAFFRETTFQGVFSYKIKSKNAPDRYKGSITNITLDGKRTDITRQWKNVPKDANEIPEGRCIFRCTINLRALYESEPRVEVFIDSASLKPLPPLPKLGEVSEHELFDVWGVKDCECIGYCHYDAHTGKYIIDDLRKPNFASLGYYPCDLTEKPIQIVYNDRPYGITEDGYYLLTWKLLRKNEQNPYQIVLDYSHKPRPIEPKWFINTSRFCEAFEVRLKTEPIIPVTKGIAPIQSVIYDATGLSATQMMTDEQWLTFIAKEEYHLPLQCIRNDKNFNAFLHRYIPKRLVFNRVSLSILISTPSFQRWLAIQDNNNRFLQFLLEKGYLSNRLYEKVFLSADGKLYTADDLYYDVDAYLPDLQGFTQYMPYLSPATRQFFADNNLWEEKVKDRFKTFDCDDFVNCTLLSGQNSDSVNKILHNKDASIHFYKFLSENVSFRRDYLDLPFISDSDEVIGDFRKKFLFLSSDYGHEVCDKPWLKTIPFVFVSHAYETKTIEYFIEHFSVQEYDDKVIVEKVILSTSHDKIVANIKSNSFSAPRQRSW